MYHIPMKHLSSPAYIPLLLGFFIALAGCQQHSQWEEESTRLLSRASELDARQNDLDNSIDSLWDATTVKLDDMIPADFPPVDRNIFLKARNADHIRMFMSYNTLNDSIHSLVDAAGSYDEFLAEQARLLLSERQEFEKDKIQFLRKVSQVDPDISLVYAERFRNALAISEQ